jgi:hypothetical protein
VDTNPYLKLQCSRMEGEGEGGYVDMQVPVDTNAHTPTQESGNNSVLWWPSLKSRPYACSHQKSVAHHAPLIDIAEPLQL